MDLKTYFNENIFYLLYVLMTIYHVIRYLNPHVGKWTWIWYAFYEHCFEYAFIMHELKHFQMALCNSVLFYRDILLLWLYSRNEFYWVIYAKSAIRLVTDKYARRVYCAQCTNISVCRVSPILCSISSLYSTYTVWLESCIYLVTKAKW